MDGLSARRRAYIELSEDGALSAYSESIRAEPSPLVMTGADLRWSVNPALTGDGLIAFIKRADVRALLERVYVGHTVGWVGDDDRPCVGFLTADAADAASEFGRLCRDAQPAEQPAERDPDIDKDPEHE